VPGFAFIDYIRDLYHETHHMIVYPHAKINIGLSVTARRPDGFHDILSLFYPVGLRDILEINLAAGTPGECDFHCTGIDAGAPADNLVARAHRLLATDFPVPPLRVHLHKLIPTGAGLGGGSSDAAYALAAINELCALGLPAERLAGYAARLGSDCPFFLHDRPCLVQGRGERLSPLDFSLSAYHLLLVKPAESVSTAEAYRRVRPHPPRLDLSRLPSLPVERWQGTVTNDFEEALFPVLPAARAIKERLLAAGALYASMTGSGSALFALFDRPVDGPSLFPGHFTWQQGPRSTPA
jgi:4-diphosphocytidyl-2-C-methyl-D-erythritol kinase